MCNQKRELQFGSEKEKGVDEKALALKHNVGLRVLGTNLES